MFNQRICDAIIEIGVINQGAMFYVYIFIHAYIELCNITTHTHTQVAKSPFSQI